MKESSLSSWLYKNNCFLTSASREKPTHLCLDGGKLNIPDKLMIPFFEMYMKGLDKNEKYYVCECVSPTTIKMFCDLDFLEDTQIENDAIIEICKIMYNVILFHFKDSYNIIVCTSPPKTIDDKVKIGIHLVWPDLVISLEMAYALSRLFVSALSKNKPDKDWDKIVDKQVYSTSLRMIYSCKISNKKSEDRVYTPNFIVSLDDVNFIDDTRLDKSKMLSLCSIRVFNKESAINPIETISICDKKVSVKKNTSVDTEVNGNATERLELFIRNQTIPQWNSPLIQVKKQASFYIAKIDSMYCMNIEREHNSCGIYFCITEAGMFQRCFCKCDTLVGRKHGLCKEFKSQLFTLPMDLKTMLFPNSKGRKVQQSGKKPNGRMTVETYGSNSLMKKQETLQDYLKMSMNTIKHIESKCRG